MPWSPLQESIRRASATVTVLAAMSLVTILVSGCKRDTEPEVVEPAPGASSAVKVAEPETPPPATKPAAPNPDPAPTATRPPDPQPAAPADPLDPETRLAGQSTKVEEYATKLRGLTMAAGFLNDEEFDRLIGDLSAIVEKAQTRVVEAEMADVDTQPALLDDLDSLIADILKADEAAVDRLRVIRGR